MFIEHGMSLRTEGGYERRRGRRLGHRSKEEHDEKLRQLGRIETDLLRLSIEVGVRPYKGNFIEGERKLYEAVSDEAKQALSRWEDMDLIRKGHVNMGIKIRREI